MGFVLSFDFEFALKRPGSSGMRRVKQVIKEMIFGKKQPVDNSRNFLVFRVSGALG
jgi:hypothetical protein